MSSKIGIKLTSKYSINFSLPKRSKNKIKFIILHYTGMRKESDAIKKLCDPKSKVSSHYYIKNNGEVINFIPDLYEAWHAGKSNWRNYRSLNKYSIGIEITNPGHQHGYRNFRSKQIKSLKQLLIYLIQKYQINKKCILGHSDISPDRKKDPGEKFPWRLLAQRKLCLWHNLKPQKLKKLRGIKINTENDKIEFFKNLKKIGYNSNIKNKIIIEAFQRRFRQTLVNGKIDKECLFISKNLTVV